MYLSKSKRINTKENPDNQNIYLIYQFFVHKDKSRNQELQKCLRFNVENPFISKIYLLNEKIYNDNELGIKSDKIEQRNIINRIKFKDIFEFVKNESLNGYIATCNADIFFDKSINNLRKSKMSKEKQLLAQLRFDYTDKQLGKCKLFGPRADSQDTWIWHSRFNPYKEKKIFNIMFGKPGCDNKLIYLFNLVGFEVVNQPYFVKTYHIQKSEKRDYNSLKALPGPYMLKSPNIPNRQTEYTKIWGTVGWRLIHTHKTSIESVTNNLNRFLLEEDNEIMVKYLREQIENDNNFCIPQTEINGTVLSSVVLMINHLTNGEFFATGRINENKYGDNLQVKHLWNILNQLVMQINRDEFKNIKNLLAYSNKYMEAFQKSNLFVGLSYWDEKYRILMAENKKDFYNGFFDTLKGKNCVNRTVLNMFNYFHQNNWLCELKRQNILIISPVADKIESQINDKILDKLYNRHIFSGCSFCFIKYNGWNTHLQEEIINKIGDYDIALCDCDIYGPIVSNYVYTVGKSSIDVGEILSLYFGLWNKSLMNSYKDVIQLYLNEHWKRIN